MDNTINNKQQTGKKQKGNKEHHKSNLIMQMHDDISFEDRDVNVISQTGYTGPTGPNNQLGQTGLTGSTGPNDQIGQTDNNVVNTGDQKQVVNNWSQANTNVLRNWKLSLAKSSYVYQYVLETTRIRWDRLLVLILLASTLSTVISGISTISLTVNSETTTIIGNQTLTTNSESPTYRLVSLIINSIVLFLSAVITIAGGIIKIYKLDETVSTISAYIVKLDQFYAMVANQLILPDTLREDAVTFIKRENSNYLQLTQQGPDIDKYIEKTALLKYDDYLKDSSINFKLSQKYSNDALIDIP